MMLIGERLKRNSEITHPVAHGKIHKTTVQTDLNNADRSQVYCFHLASLENTN